jgi:hypothetical protein
MLVLVTYGLGLGIGAQIVGWLRNTLIDLDSSMVLQQFQTFWMVPAVFAAIIMVMFAILFNEKDN